IEEAIAHPAAPPIPPATPTRSLDPPSSPRQEIRDVAGAAYQELDAGELSFAIAEPTLEGEAHSEAAQSWRPHELGALRKAGAALKLPETHNPETQKPDTKDGPPAAPAPAPVPQLGSTQQFNRRPTLIAPVGAPPAYSFLASELASLDRIPSQKPPSFG